MKKAGLFAIVLSAVLLSGCGQDINEKMDEPVSTTTAAAASEIKYEGTASAAATETETESVTIAETVSEENVDTENTAKNENTEKTDDYSDIAGYWFVDGERSKSALLFTSDGKFTAYYPSGASFDGYIEKNFDQESNSYAYCLYQSTEKLYNTFPDNGEKEKTDIYMSTEDGTHYVKLYGEGGIAPDGLRKRHNRDLRKKRRRILCRHNLEIGRCITYAVELSCCTGRRKADMQRQWTKGVGRI